MPDFDILSPTAYGAQPAQGSQGGGFNIVAANAGGPQVRPSNPVFLNGVQSGQPQAQQPQGAPISGLMAGVLNLPQYSGTAPGAVYTTPGQVPGQTPGQQGQMPVQQGGQPQNAGSALASALGMGARSLFDGVVGGGR